MLAQETSFGMLIGGEVVGAASGRSFTVTDPATGVAIGCVPDADGTDTALAVGAAKAALPEWRARSPRERSAIVSAIGGVVRDHGDELAELDALGSGNPLQAMRRDVEIGLETLSYMCGIAQETKGDTIPVGRDHLDFTVREPYGIVARITPFNHPLMFALEKIAAPLVAGNCVVLKPSPFGVASPLALAELLRDVLPPGVLNVLSERGSAANAALVQHPDVKRIAFTGGVSTAQRIIASSAESGIKSFSLELGGKNPLIVFPDFPLEEAIDIAVGGMNLTWTLGQSCGSTSRLFVHDDVHDDLVEGVIERFRAMSPGPPTSIDTDVGCLSSDEQLARVSRYVETGLTDGATLATGGRQPPAMEGTGGHYYEPTLFTRVDQRMRIAREEIFGPVLSVIRWRDASEMLEQVNSVSYGLTANVLTSDITTAHRIARDVEAGYVGINARDGRHFTGAPFGGYKDSGVGSETSLEELLGYTQLKNVSVWL